LLVSRDAQPENHYHQRQYHPRHSQTFPGTSSSSTAATATAAAASATSIPGSHNYSIAPQPPTTPPPPPQLAKLDDDLDAFVTADHDLDHPDDEELPDYATSQAQASARQRDEAARRARELEEGWLRGRAERARRPWRTWERNADW